MHQSGAHLVFSFSLWVKYGAVLTMTLALNPVDESTLIPA